MISTAKNVGELDKMAQSAYCPNGVPYRHNCYGVRCYGYGYVKQGGLFYGYCKMATKKEEVLSRLDMKGEE